MYWNYFLERYFVWEYNKIFYEVKICELEVILSAVKTVLDYSMNCQLLFDWNKFALNQNSCTAY